MGRSDQRIGIPSPKACSIAADGRGEFSTTNAHNGCRGRNKRMYPNNEMAQEDSKGVSARKSRSPQTNFQLKGVWLYVARGVWIASVLTELIVIIFTLFASRGHGLTICSWTDDTSC